MCICIPKKFLQGWGFVAGATNIAIGIGFIILGVLIKDIDRDLF